MTATGLFSLRNIRSFLCALRHRGIGVHARQTVVGEQAFVSRIFDGDFRQSQHSSNLHRGGHSLVVLLGVFLCAIASVFDVPHVAVVS